MANSLTITIQTEMAEKSNYELQISQNNADLSLQTKHSLAEQDAINSAYTAESSLIRSEMNAMDDKLGNEYEALMNDLKNLQNERDNSLSQIQTVQKDRETEITVENDTLQTFVDDISSDIDAFKEARDKHIEDGDYT